MRLVTHKATLGAGRTIHRYSRKARVTSAGYHVPVIKANCEDRCTSLTALHASFYKNIYTSWNTIVAMVDNNLPKKAGAETRESKWNLGEQ